METTILFILLMIACAAGIASNVSWYRCCVKLNDDWYNTCVKVTNECYEICHEAKKRIENITVGDSCAED